MMGSLVLFWTLLLLTSLTVFTNCTHAHIPTKPDQSPRAILDRAGLEIRRIEPSWYFGTPVCNFPPLMDEQEDFSCGDFYVGSAQSRRIVALVTVHQIINPKAVSRWMTNVPIRAAGWVVVPYDVGVPAYLSTLQDPSTVEITFAKGRFVVSVNGTSKMDIDRVARSLLAQIAD
jgi:hypothetical protein